MVAVGGAGGIEPTTGTTTPGTTTGATTPRTTTGTTTSSGGLLDDQQRVEQLEQQWLAAALRSAAAHGWIAMHGHGHAVRLRRRNAPVQGGNWSTYAYGRGRRP